MVLGVDVGTTSVKAVLLGEGGEVLAEAEHPHPLHSPHPGFAEEDPEDWWRGFRAVVPRVLQGRDPKGLKALAFNLIVICCQIQSHHLVMLLRLMLIHNHHLLLRRSHGF